MGHQKIHTLDKRELGAGRQQIFKKKGRRNMNNAEALKALQDYYDLSNPGEDDEFYDVEVA